MELYLLSNSRMPGGEPFAWCADYLQAAWDGRIRTAALIPFAGVTLSWDDYEAYVSQALSSIDLQVQSVHRSADAAALIEEADIVLVGGGNTFHLTYHLYASGLIPIIQQAVRMGKPYMGWSAGANVACPTLRTTNDMPIIQPPSFETLSLVRFQINPHYTEKTIANHGGETRVMRIEEFLAANPNQTVVGLPEGCLLHAKGSVLHYWGAADAKLFHSGSDTVVVKPNSDIGYLLS